MNLMQALTEIALLLDVDPVDLATYANEDPHDGWDENRGSWPVGSIWTVEGRVLYAIVRALGLTNAVELGTRYGCSATHIAEALKANGAGKLTTIDLYVHGPTELRIPPHLDEYVEHITGEAVSYLAMRDEPIDLIFEDLDHSAQTVAAVAGIARQKLAPGGVLVVHDAMHFNVGKDVRRGLEMAELPAGMWLIAPSDCGLAIWRKAAEVDEPVDDAKTESVPATKVAEEPQEPETLESEAFGTMDVVEAPAVEDTTEEKPKRKRAAK